jgi:hypothetical protein
VIKSESPAPSVGSRLKKGRVVSDEEEEEELPSRLALKKRKSTVVHSDEEEEEEEEQKPAKKSRTFVSREVVMKRKQEASLRAMMQSEDERECHDVKPWSLSTKHPIDDETSPPSGQDELDDIQDEDSAPEHVPLKQPKAAPKEKPKGIDVSLKARKKKVVAPVGKNGKKMKRVKKTRTVEGKKKGYMGMCVDLSQLCPVN